MQNATCHPERPARAKGLCGACYNGKWVKEKKPKRRYIPQASLRRRYRHRYGIELSDYEDMLSLQSGKCAICNEEKDYSLYVDHCHTTGKVRQLLCAGCNTLVGAAENSLLFLAQEYINKHKENMNG